MNRYLTEFIGTFFLVLTIGLSTNTANSQFAPIAIGSALMVMVYMGGHISGAHYNPAVTLAVCLRGKCGVADVVPYWIAQIAGAMAAAALVPVLMPGKTFVPKPGADVAMLPAILNEVLFTFALALVVLNVATHPKTAGNSFYGLAIGFTVLAAAFAGGGISGGAYNPAVGVGPLLVDLIRGGKDISNVLIYIVGPLAGGALAAGVFQLQVMDQPVVNERKVAPSGGA